MLVVAVLGATGRTGQHVVRELTARGHQVRLLARNPDKLPPDLRDGDVVVGDSRDPDLLARLVLGTDAVLSALGPTSKEPALHSDTARALIPAMDAAGVRRFLGVSGAGIDVPGDQKSTSAKLISRTMQLLGGDVVKDKPLEYTHYAASDLDWTLVRPPRLLDGPATGRLEHDAHRSTRSTSITRADLAGFLVDCLEQHLYPGLAPFVATAK